MKTSFQAFVCGGLRSLILFATVVALLLTSFVQHGVAQSEHRSLPATSQKHRMIVLTDIGAEADDTESMVRLLLYSDVIDIQGVVATTSVWKKTSVSPELIREVVAAYGKVHDNLVRHDSGYPTAGRLEGLITSGFPAYGMEGVGDGKDSTGSALIVRELEKSDERPLWISVWGGANTLAQALYNLRTTKSPAELDRLVGKLRVYTISDQDNSGPWMRKNFPKLFYVVSPGGDYGSATWTGINVVVPGIDNTTISNQWLAQHIQQGHGPLGAAYPDVAYGMEGDTPSWLGLIPNGLSDPEHPNWGGWGGRYELYKPDVQVTDRKTFLMGEPIEAETRAVWTNAMDEAVLPVAGEHGRATRAGDKMAADARATIWRWRNDFQNDFAARMEWATKPYAQANHPPRAILDCPGELTVHSGQAFALSGHATDPDGDNVSLIWLQYPEAGSWKKPIKMPYAENLARVDLIAPKVEKPETVHIILRVTDKGSPPLTRYRRVIVTVVP
jgi:Protein of unknown function (DUF1593)